MLQVADRAPLTWDEAARVYAASGFTDALREASAREAWDWMNAQNFYPFLAPALQGIALLALGDALTAAWLPPLLAYGGTGILVGQLARDLGAGPIGGWLAAALFWLAPIEARLAGGGFTEPLGAFVEVALVLVLVRLHGRPTLRRGLLAGALVALCWWLKYDYGLVGAGVLGLTGLVVAIATRKWGRVYPFVAGAGVAAVAILALMVANWDHKLRGVRAFVEQAVPAGGDAAGGPPTAGVDFLYYPRALLEDPEIGLQPVVALAFLFSVGWAVLSWRRRPNVRPVVLFVAVWTVAYSVATLKFGRISATLLPSLAALIGAAVSAAWARAAGRSRSRPAGDRPVRSVRAPAVAAGVALVLLAAGLAAQLPGLGEQLHFLRPNPPAAAAAGFVERHLEPWRRPLMMLGATRELSPFSVKLAWRARLGEPVPRVARVGERPPGERRAALVAALRRVRPGHVVAVDVRPGSRLYTDDYRQVSPSQPHYVRLARQLAAAGVLRQTATATVDRGRLQVTMWAPTGRNPAAPR